MSKAHEDARDAYVGMMVPTVMMSPRRPVVYLDESFVHHHYSSHADSLYHPDDPKTKSKHKGRRYCFIAGILDDGSEVAHLLGLDIFEGGKKSGKIVKDYHTIVPNVAPTDLKTTIWKALKTHLDEHVLPVVVAMAQNRGHHVVYSAPGFSELQPIELVWANVKGTVGRAYTSTTTFQDVRDRLEKAFFELDTEVIHNTIESSTAKLHRALHDAEAGAADLCRDKSESDASSDVDTSSSSVCDSMSGSDSDD
ncbi:hypothetical protein DYB28_007463 [Aphanomyces astaci]|uniref:Tc1-like transposase DDE domain-containing protein n=1 Tax=Aphanomyces astaci TaxID=112090 RepID=A0A9X8DY82_APHAT|nr:hypothetical protein DYB28_007463 [Aphanomyces astaci]